jgi:glutaconate CoA-transferase subunit B
VRHVAVGNASPIPRRRRCSRARNGRPYVSLLGSQKHTFWTDGGRELFDCAGQGRIDVFFLSGGEIDGQGNINLVSIGDPEKPPAAFPARSARRIVFRRAQGDPVPHRALQAHPGAKVSYISAPGGSDDNIHRTGGRSR